MSPQIPNRGIDLPGRESAENLTPIKEESRKGAAADQDGSTGDGRKPGRWRLELAITAVVLGLLSFVIGLQPLSVGQTIAPVGSNRAATRIPVEPLAEPPMTDPMRDPEPAPEPLLPATV